MAIYPPPHHQTKDIQQMIAVMKTFPFGLLLTANNEEVLATHIPIIYNESSGKLVAHIDASNPQVETLFDGAKAKIVFQGPNCYISPSVYTTDQFPTWNYIIVHVKGILKMINDPEQVKDTMVAMTSFLEGDDPKFVLPKDHPRMDRLVPYIRAFEMEITHWDGKFKLSQDKNRTDFNLAKEELKLNTHEAYRSFIDQIYNNL